MKLKTEGASARRSCFWMPRFCRRLLALVLMSLGCSCCQQMADPVGPIATALRSHDFQGAETLSQTALTSYPRDYRLWTLHGIATAGTGKLSLALEDYQHALRLSPTYLPALEEAAQTEMQLGQDAGPLLARILAQRPDDPATEALLGVLHYRKGDCAAAVQGFGKASAIIQHNPEALTDEGVCFTVLKKYSDAVDAFGSALALDPVSPVARYNLALAQLNAHRPDEALGTIQPVVDAMPAHADALAGSFSPPVSLLAGAPRPRGPQS